MEDMDAIYRQHARTVYHFLLAQSHDPALSEDLTQETFYQAVRSIGSFNGSCKISVWLCQIAKHLLYQHLRKAGREVPEDLPEIPSSSAEESLLEKEGRMDLRAFGGLSFREIGDVCGRTEVWARVTFYRAKEHLREGGICDEP